MAPGEEEGRGNEGTGKGRGCRWEEKEGKDGTKRRNSWEASPCSNF